MNGAGDNPVMWKPLAVARAFPLLIWSYRRNRFDHHDFRSPPAHINGMGVRTKPLARRTQARGCAEA